MSYFVLAFYQFTPLNDPKREVKEHTGYFAGRDITSRIYISEEGINGQMSASEEEATLYMDWLHAKEPFRAVQFKIHLYHEQVFPRQTVKYRKYLVGREHDINLTKQGTRVSPKEWKKRLESGQEQLLLDVRNQKETEVGHFEGATLPPCENFREFEKYAEKLSETQELKHKPVMMYCTGGIRCELFSSILKEKGFEKVYQLDGGVIQYGLQEGSTHWLGKLFVFDERMVIPLREGEKTPIVGQCYVCHTASEEYYNCANMECNELFLCCKKCLEEKKGCCSTKCMQSNRIRPLVDQNPHKPFRRKHHYECGST